MTKQEVSTRYGIPENILDEYHSMELCDAVRMAMNVIKMSKILVAYFSASGETAKLAETIADVTGGDIHEIKPAQPYTTADLNWNDTNSRSSVEMKNPLSRPAVASKVECMAQYDTAFVGYPKL